MGVIPGYKQTDVGVIPEDWNAVKLGDHATFRTGPFGSALHKSDYVYGGVPIINPMQIIDGKLVPTPRMTISEMAARRLSEFRLCAGEVVIGRRGDMGRCAVVETESDGWLCGTGSMIVRPKASLDERFAQRVLSDARTVTAIEAASVGTTMVNLNQGTLGNLLIPLPSNRAEQANISLALSDADALIKSLEQLLAKNHQVKQGAMQELLTGKKRLPEFSDKWEIRKLGELSAMSSGGTPSTSVAAYYDGDIPWVSISDMTKAGKIIDSTDRCLSALGFSNSSAQLFPAGTVLYAMYASLGECSIAGVELCTSQAILGIRTGKALDPEFLYHWLTLQKSVVKTMGQQGTQANLNKGMVQAFRLGVPSLVEQRAISAALSDIDAELAALNAKLAKARQLKQGMMQELLTGRIRLV